MTGFGKSADMPASVQLARSGVILCPCRSGRASYSFARICGHHGAVTPVEGKRAPASLVGLQAKPPISFGGKVAPDMRQRIDVVRIETFGAG